MCRQQPLHLPAERHPGCPTKLQMSHRCEWHHCVCYLYTFCKTAVIAVNQEVEGLDQWYCDISPRSFQRTQQRKGSESPSLGEMAPASMWLPSLDRRVSDPSTVLLASLQCFANLMMIKKKNIPCYFIFKIPS